MNTLALGIIAYLFAQSTLGWYRVGGWFSAITSAVLDVAVIWLLAALYRGAA